MVINILPNPGDFAENISRIDEMYDFTSKGFSNGVICNLSGTNEGSEKIFTYVKIAGIVDKEFILKLFGKFYTEDVLQNPEGTNHQNIRQFMKTGMDGLVFPDELALTQKK